MNQEAHRLPQLPHDFQDKYHGHYGHASSNDVYTHCKRELMHTIWKTLLNERFADAYNNGIVIQFFDGVTCHVFPRFFTYAANYPEKWVLCWIRNEIDDAKI